MRPLDDPAVLAGDADRVAGAFDAGGARALEQRDALAHELVLERGRHLGVLERQHLLAGDEQGHLRAEGVEHVRELDAGDAGADHDDVLRQLGRRVRLAGGEHPLAVDGRELGNPGARPGGDHDEVGFELLDPVGGLDHDLVRALSRPVPRSSRTFCDSSSSHDGVVEASARSTSTRSRSASRSTPPSARGPSCARGRARPARRRWRSSTWTGCSPTGGRRRR